MGQGYDDTTVDTIFSALFDINQDWYAKEEHDSDVNLVYRPPPLYNIWLEEQRCSD